MLDEKNDYDKEQFKLDIIIYLDKFLSKHNNSGVAILISYIKKYLLFSDSCYLQKVKDRFKDLSYDLESFFINLDIIAMGIEHQKKDFDNFDKIVDDVIGLVLKCDDLDYYINYVRPVIDYILKDENYKNDKNIRKYLILFLRNLDDKSMCAKLINCLRVCRCDCALDDVHSELEKEAKHYFPQMAIYVDDNYFYILNKLLNEKNLHFRKYILSMFEKFSCSLFDELNSHELGDSFKLFVDIVFDSDSYSEIKAKLKCMYLDCYYLYSHDALWRYDVKEIGLSNALNFYNRDFKDTYCGKKVAYPTNTMNVIEKPERIIDRMKYLYRRIDSSISYDFMDDIYDDALDIEMLDDAINEEIRKRKTFLGRIKSKVKSRFGTK